MKAIVGRTLTSGELAREYQQKQKERSADPDAWRGLSFGHPDLDRITGGVRRKEFVVLAGAQKAGKTTVGLAWSLRFAEQVQQGELVLFVSLEMNEDAIAGRVLANLSGLDVTRLRDYRLEGNEWVDLENGVQRLEKLPLLFNIGTYNMDGIRELFKQYQGKIRVVIVDYFQLMAGSERGSKRWEQLEELSRELKQLAMTESCSVVAVSQQTREALKNPEKQKDPNTLAGTQALARDCDLLIIILPYVKDNEEVPHMRKLFIALARNSTCGQTLDAIFSGAYCRFGAPLSENFAPVPEPEPIDPQLSYWEV